VVDVITSLSERTGLSVRCLLRWAEVKAGQFYRWRQRYGKANEHNARVPRDHWLLPREVEAILAFHSAHPLDGYRRLTFMMNDAQVVAVSPSSVYRVLREAGVLDRHSAKRSSKGTGFGQPSAAHQHWHVDIAYLNIAGTFYYLCSVLDGYSRYLVHWEIRESMKEADVETILQRAREQFPGLTPRIISDNGPQFIARDFRHFIRICGMTHVRTSPYYPQSNGKLERWHRTLKSTTIRPKTPATVEQAKRLVGEFVEDYNHRRLHSAIGFVTPMDKLNGREDEIWAQRDERIERARELRRQAREAARADAQVLDPQLARPAALAR
jgi:transposase InsO family protein